MSWLILPNVLRCVMPCRQYIDNDEIKALVRQEWIRLEVHVRCRDQDEYHQLSSDDAHHRCWPWRVYRAAAVGSVGRTLPCHIHQSARNRAGQSPAWLLEEQAGFRRRQPQTAHAHFCCHAQRHISKTRRYLLAKFVWGVFKRFLILAVLYFHKMDFYVVACCFSIWINIVLRIFGIFDFQFYSHNHLLAYQEVLGYSRWRFCCFVQILVVI